MSAKADEKREALELLRKWDVTAGVTVTTVVQRRTAAGVTSVRALITHDGEPFDISPWAARAIGWSFDRDHGGVKVTEQGTDPAALLVIELSRAMFGDIRALTHHPL